MGKKALLWLIIMISVLTLSSCGKPFNSEIETAIEEGTITPEMMENEILVRDKRKYLTQKLTQFQKNDEVGKALALIYAAPDSTLDNSFLDGSDAYASSSFINWIKRAVLSENPETEGYQFKWEAAMMMNQFTFKKAGEDRTLTVLTKNGFIKNVDEKDRFMAGTDEPTEKVEEDYDSISQYASEETASPKSGGSSSGGSSSGSGTKMRTCPNCHGTGWVTYYATDNPWEEGTVGECPMCDGTGKVSD